MKFKFIVSEHGWIQIPKNKLDSKSIRCAEISKCSNMKCDRCPLISGWNIDVKRLKIKEIILNIGEKI